MPRLFGTNGVRGVVGETMTPELALDLGRALGTWLHEANVPWDTAEGRPRVVIGMDHRTSNRMVASAVTSGLLSAGIDVIDVGAAPTPAIQYAVRERPDAAAGVIITASHNPPQFNGIKFCRGDGREMEPEQEEEIETIHFDQAFRRAAWNDNGEVLTIGDAIERYHAGILRVIDAEVVRKAGFTVAVDTANGAGCGSLPFLLQDLGCRVVSLNAQPDGRFPGHPSEPTPDNAGDLQDLVKRTKADLGVLVDGDADRAIFIDENGDYVWGDRSLALLAAQAVKDAGGGIVCTPVSSSSCVEEMVDAAGGEVVYTIVGSPKVARAMVDNDAVFGGEENGGLIVPAHQHTRDAAMSAARMLEVLARTGRRMSELVAEVPKKSVSKLKTEVPDEQKTPVLEAVRAQVEAGAIPDGYVVKEVDSRDGVKIWMEQGWVLMRPSGTEPIMRVYAEADDRSVAEKMGKDFLGMLESCLATVKGKAA